MSRLEGLAAERPPWEGIVESAAPLLTGARLEWGSCSWGSASRWFCFFEQLGLSLHVAQREAFSRRLGSRVAYYLCGRRWGKTVMGACEVIRHLILTPRARVLYLAAHHDQLDEGLGYLRMLLDNLAAFGVGYEDRSRSTRAPRLTVGRGESATIYPSVFLREGKLRGRGYTMALIDEAELMDAQVFEYAILPALGERRGEIVLLSTPRGQSYLLDYVREAGGVVLNYPTWTNPLFPRSELETAWRTWNRAAFAQEFGAELVEAVGRYFVALPEVVKSLPEEVLATAVGLDWGVDDPFAAVWVAKDSRGDYYVYRELYQRGLPPESQARMVREWLHGRETVLADPSVFRESPVSVAHLWFEAGLPMPQAGTRDRLGSLSLLRQLMAQGRLKVVDGVCLNLMRELSEARVNRKRVEDLEGDDHAIDALRYAVSWLHTQTPLRSQPPPQDTIVYYEALAERYERLRGLEGQRW